MAAGFGLCQGRNMSEKDKAERLAAKLRENLRRRKTQARELREDQPNSEATDDTAHDPAS